MVARSRGEQLSTPVRTATLTRMGNGGVQLWAAASVDEDEHFAPSLDAAVADLTTEGRR